jgi:hypothetical protein
MEGKVETEKKNTKEKQLTKKEIEKIVDDKIYNINEKLIDLKEQIDRLYEYVDEVFLLQKKEKIVENDELMIIYDNLNIKGNFKDSVPLDLFKDEVQKKLNLTENMINEKITELEKRDIIYIIRGKDKTERIRDPERCLTGKNGKLLCFITWMKK